MVEPNLPEWLANGEHSSEIRPIEAWKVGDEFELTADAPKIDALCTRNARTHVPLRRLRTVARMEPKYQIFFGAVRTGDGCDTDGKTASCLNQRYVFLTPSIEYPFGETRLCVGNEARRRRQSLVVLRLLVQGQGQRRWFRVLKLQLSKSADNKLVVPKRTQGERTTLSRASTRASTSH